MNRYFHFISNYSKLYFLFILSATLCVLSGCASDQPKISSPPTIKEYRSHQRHNYRHSRAYNRPYRVKGRTYYPMTSPEGYSEIGMASWYGHESGSKTSMGTYFRPEGISAAHKTLPLPSKVRVTNLHNGRSIVLVVNDRGPFKPNRIIDLSHGAARKIGVNGLAKVKVVYLGRAD
ncbi:MAG: septal ring lytic transglycosylase RlpA family protein [Methylococcaceae bacterium]|nr:septal ring lytic transglycosylase RlpA family protein [Methylococcaceae bacterium]